jgi:hypothetical protein
MDVPQYGTNGTHERLQVLEGAVEVWKPSLRGSAGVCAAAQAAANRSEALCYFAPHLYPYLDDVDGVFVMQSDMDTAGIDYAIGLSCSVYANGAVDCVWGGGPDGARPQ